MAVLHRKATSLLAQRQKGLALSHLVKRWPCQIFPCDFRGSTERFRGWLSAVSSLKVIIPPSFPQDGTLPKHGLPQARLLIHTSGHMARVHLCSGASVLGGCLAVKGLCLRSHCLSPRGCRFVERYLLTFCSCHTDPGTLLPPTHSLL